MLLETSSVKVFSYSSSHGAFSRTIFCVEKGQLKCKRAECKRKWTNCQHVDEFESWVEDQDESMRIKFLGVPDEPPPSRSSRDKNSDAVPRIQLPLHFMAPQTALRISPGHPGHWIPPCAVCASEKITCKHCIPDQEGACECGASWDSRNPVTERWKECKPATLMGPHCALTVYHYYRPCSDESCGKRKMYDGLKDGIFCFSRHTFFLHEVMFSYIDAMSISKMTFTAYHSILRKQYARANSHVDLCHNNTLR